MNMYNWKTYLIAYHVLSTIYDFSEINPKANIDIVQGSIPVSSRIRGAADEALLNTLCNQLYGKFEKFRESTSVLSQFSSKVF